MLSLTVFLMNVDDGIPQTDKIPIISIPSINLILLATFCKFIQMFFAQASIISFSSSSQHLQRWWQWLCWRSITGSIVPILHINCSLHPKTLMIKIFHAFSSSIYMHFCDFSVQCINWNSNYWFFLLHVEETGAVPCRLVSGYLLGESFTFNSFIHFFCSVRVSPSIPLLHLLSAGWPW